MGLQQVYQSASVEFHAAAAFECRENAVRVPEYLSGLNALEHRSNRTRVPQSTTTGGDALCCELLSNFPEREALRVQGFDPSTSRLWVEGGGPCLGLGFLPQFRPVI